MSPFLKCLVTTIMALKDAKSIARFIASPECKSVIILSGAGMSVASGSEFHLFFILVIFLFQQQLSLSPWDRYFNKGHRPSAITFS